MELHDVRTHHSAKDLTLRLEYDNQGNLVEFKGRGMRLVNIYEMITENQDVTVWLEDPQTRQVVWKSWFSRTRMGKPKTGPYTLEMIQNLHRKAYPHCRLVIWQGGNDGQYIGWVDPFVMVTTK